MLTVCDNGAPMSKNIAAQLFEGPVDSQTGFGICLYQSSKLAAQFGYRLALTANSPGTICFALTNEAGVNDLLPERHVA